jgi:ParB-like chromosome segregation protein Spo0J
MSKDLFAKLVDDIVEQAEKIFEQLDQLDLDQKVEAINRIRKALHEKSPFKADPVDCVLWVKADNVRGNDYNPNTVAPPEMRLLEHSIKMDGYTQPVVVYPEDGEHYTVVDGFHRTRVAKESPTIREHLKGHIPVTIIRSTQSDEKNRMAATIRHNRARGVHGVMPMIDIVAALLRNGWTDEQVAKELGMDADEVLRFKQHTGLPELFKEHQFSRAWE